jgi:hypothetical protein
MGSQETAQLVTVPFVAGLDARTQLEALDPTRGLVRLENLRANKRGALSKRPGFESLDSVGEEGEVGSLIFPWRQGAPAVVLEKDGTFRVLCKPATGRDAGAFDVADWADANRRNSSRLSEVVARRFPIANIRNLETDASAEAVDSCRFGDWMLHAYSSDGLTDIYAVSGAVVAGTVTVSGSNVRLVRLPSVAGDPRAMVLYEREDQLYRRIVKYQSYATAFGLQLETETAFSTTLGDAYSGQNWDAVECSGRVFVAYITSFGYAASEIAADGTVYQTLDERFVDDIDSIGVGVWDGTTRGRFVIWHDLGDDEVVIDRWTDAVALTTVRVGQANGSMGMSFAATGPGDGMALVNISGGAGCRVYRVASMTVDGFGTSVYGGAHFRSRALKVDRTWYVIATQAPTINSVDYPTVLAELFREDDVGGNGSLWLSCMRPVAVVAPRLSRLDSIRIHNLTMVGQTMVAPIAVAASAVSATLESAEFRFGEPWQVAVAGNGAHFARGSVDKWDGIVAHEAAFVHRPAFLAIGNAGGGNINASNGPVRYVGVWEHTDAQGNIEYSAPSNVLAYTGGGTDRTITCTFYPLNLSAKYRADSPPKLSLYRTTSGGFTFHFIESKSSFSGSPIVFTDIRSDANIESRRILYKSPGIPGDAVDRVGPPGLYAMVSHQNRLVGWADDGITLWFTNEAVQGEAYYWNELFALPIAEGGDGVALASQDGTLFAFKRNHIFVVSGDGPAENGVGGWNVSRLPSDVGCVDPRSIAITPDGIWFRSPKGLELLARGGSVVWAGEAVSGVLTDDVEITSAVADSERATLLWTCRGPDDDGFTIVFDYANNVWSIDRVGSDDVAESAAVVNIGGVRRYARLQAGSVVLAESKSSYLDMGNWVTSRIETGLIRLSGLVGEHDVDRVLLLAAYDGAHGLRVSLAHDYRPFTLRRQYTDAQVATLATGVSAYRIEVIPGNEKRGMSVRVALEDVEPATTVDGAGASFVGLVFEGSGRPGRARGQKGER